MFLIRNFSPHSVVFSQFWPVQKMKVTYLQISTSLYWNVLICNRKYGRYQLFFMNMKYFSENIWKLPVTEHRLAFGFIQLKILCKSVISLCSHKGCMCVCAKLLQIRSVAQSCLTLCNPMNRSTPGLPIYHQLPDFTQTHVHRVSDAIQPSHPLSSPSFAPNPSQHQSLFQ